MLEITTVKKQNQLVKIDGFEYEVRNPGAGESYALTQAQRYITKLEDKIKADTATEEEKEKHSALIEKALKICVTLFDAKGNEEAQDSLDRLDAEILFNVIEQVFNSMKEADGATS